MKFQELIEMKDKLGSEVLDGISVLGLVEEVYDYKTGHHEQYGDWSLQNVKLSDGERSITCCFKNRNQIEGIFKGRKVSLNSSYREKAGRSVGVKLIEETHEGKQILKFIVTPSAQILWGGVGLGGEEPATASAPAPKKKASAPPKEEEATVTPYTNMEEALMEAYAFLTTDEGLKMKQDLEAKGYPLDVWARVGVALFHEFSRRQR